MGEMVAPLERGVPSGVLLDIFELLPHYNDWNSISQVSTEWRSVAFSAAESLKHVNCNRCYLKPLLKVLTLPAP